MKVFLATDHAGLELKNKIKDFLVELGYDVNDLGAFNFDINDDYPDFISKAALEVSKSPLNKAIIFGGSGQGEAICANRFKNVRAVVYYGPSDSIQKDAMGNEIDIIESARMHNDANILSIGARFITIDDAKKAIKKFLETNFSEEERHIRRIQKINDCAQ